VKINIVPWTFYDIIMVLLCVFLLSLIIYGLANVLIINQKNASIIFSYAFPIVSVLVPYLWIKYRYKTHPKELLGIRKSHYPPRILISVGIIAALVSSIIIRFSPLWQDSMYIDIDVSKDYLLIILMPASLIGFSKFILGPFSEELLFRGFIYGYFRRKSGIVLGLIFQALISSLLHIKFVQIAFNNGGIFFLFLSPFLISLLLGILYETTGSIYSCIICHGLFNYLLFVLMIPL